MRAIGLVLRAAAFLYNLLVALAMFLLALVVLSSGRHNLDLAAVPLEGKSLTVTLLIASIYAFVAMVLALRKGRWVRTPMLVWNLALFLLVLTTPMRGGYTFRSQDHVKLGLYLLAGSLIALAGSWLQWRQGGRGARGGG